MTGLLSRCGGARVPSDSRRLGDTGFDSSSNAKAKTTLNGELYACLYALDPGLAQLFEAWPMLARDARQTIVNQVMQFASVTKDTK